MDPLLSQWGIQLGTGILADEQDRLGRGSPTALMVRTFTTHDITENFTTPIIFPVSRSVTFDATQGKDWDFVSLAQTSPKSWEETTLTNTEPVFDEEPGHERPLYGRRGLNVKTCGTRSETGVGYRHRRQRRICHQRVAHLSLATLIFS